MVPGRASKPLGEITLPVQFGTASNYHVEHINFYVANFDTAYHTILGRPALAKFMAVPHYAERSNPAILAPQLLWLSTKSRTRLTSPRRLISACATKNTSKNKKEHNPIADE